MGTYRCYLSLTKRHKCFAVLRIIVEIVIFVLIYINSLYVICIKLKVQNEVWHSTVVSYHVINIINSVLFSVCGVLSCRSYSQFKSNFNVIDSHYLQDLMYINSLKKIKAVILITLFSIFIFSLGYLSFKILTVDEFLFELFDVGYYVLKLAEKCTETRCIIEHVTLYAYITMLHTLLKCVNQRILNIQDTFIKRGDEVLFKGNFRHNFLSEVKIISAHYKKLLNCSRHLSACFNIQVLY